MTALGRAGFNAAFRGTFADGVDFARALAERFGVTDPVALRETAHLVETRGEGTPMEMGAAREFRVLAADLEEGR